MYNLGRFINCFLSVSSDLHGIVPMRSPIWMVREPGLGFCFESFVFILNYFLTVKLHMKAMSKDTCQNCAILVKMGPLKINSLLWCRPCSQLEHGSGPCSLACSKLTTAGHARHVQAAVRLLGAKHSCPGGGDARWILTDYLQAALMKRLEITKLLL